MIDCGNHLHGGEDVGLIVKRYRAGLFDFVGNVCFLNKLSLVSREFLRDNLVFLDRFAAERTQERLPVLLEVLHELIVTLVMELVVGEARQLLYRLAKIHTVHAESAVVELILLKPLIDRAGESVADSHRPLYLVLVLVLFLAANSRLSSHKVKTAVEVELSHASKMVLKVVQLA
eukprot:CAMPEP_0185584008 /NCGR_PEP_ID=MMETSP0434-20130131/29676_1 /TAXON_ID=626734 ORGANISM="Favella taraikaensis, Strain Fe Narragansett Bay" /NCGR_SAMPLE_ID=MMETSP0434 /ASSEMBLY_ACC=CAM_ASM_000379 /LENGTH=174 /DNA_ID=CAMNT_0028203511 /DNA_START=142 /DNA_END=666 /DNA_ORIENTATION=+